MAKSESAFMTIAEAASELGVSRQTIWRWLPRIAHIRDGNVIRLCRRSFCEFIDSIMEVPEWQLVSGGKRGVRARSGTPE
jgi:excisionase family DNA binding protein